MSVDLLRDLNLFTEYAAVLAGRGITELTEVQRLGVDSGVCNGTSMVVAAPTSSGKTLLGEVAAVRSAGVGLTAFVVSHRALAMEIFHLFSERFSVDGVPLLRAGICTGEEDDVRGAWGDFSLVVFTYERFFGALSASPALTAALRGLVVDEVQHLGDPERGHVVELLLARWKCLRASRPGLQLVALSACLHSPAELSEWLGVALIQLDRRDPPLDQEVWLPTRIDRFESGAEHPEGERHAVDVTDVGAVVQAIRASGRGPVGVMATTRPLAAAYAAAIAGGSAVDAGLAAQANDLRGLGEEGAANEDVVAAFMHGVGVHHADMPRDQRYFIEDAFREGRLHTLVATPTLVAGVNLPFRTVLYPKLRRWNGTEEALISPIEYANGAGRAGRRGYHSRGTSVVVCESLADYRSIRGLLSMAPDPVSTHLSERSAEYVALHAMPAGVAASPDDVWALLGATLAAHRDPSTLTAWEVALGPAFTWGESVGLWTAAAESRRTRTPLGAAVAASGMEPREVVEAAEAVRPHALVWTNLSPAEVLTSLAGVASMADYQPYANREHRASGGGRALRLRRPSGARGLAPTCRVWQSPSACTPSGC